MESIVRELDRLISATRATWNLVNMVPWLAKRNTFMRKQMFLNEITTFFRFLEKQR